MSEVNKLPYEKKQKIKKYIKENYKNKSLNEMAKELKLNHGTVSLIKTSMGLTNGVKNNNNLFNLEWTTIKGNTQHAAMYGLMRRGESHSSSKMTNEQVLELINFYNNSGTKSEAIKNFDFVTKSIAEKIYNKSRWKHFSHLMKW